MAADLVPTSVEQYIHQISRQGRLYYNELAAFADLLGLLCLFPLAQLGLPPIDCLFARNGSISINHQIKRLINGLLKRDND